MATTTAKPSQPAQRSGGGGKNGKKAAEPGEPEKRGKKPPAMTLTAILSRLDKLKNGGKRAKKRGKKAAEPAKPAGGPWLTRTEAAQYIGLATKTLDNWRACNDPRRPPSYNIGGKVLYKQGDLDAWLEKQKEVV